MSKNGYTKSYSVGVRTKVALEDDLEDDNPKKSCLPCLVKVSQSMSNARKFDMEGLVNEQQILFP